MDATPSPHGDSDTPHRGPLTDLLLAGGLLGPVIAGIFVGALLLIAGLLLVQWSGLSAPRGQAATDSSTATSPSAAGTIAVSGPPVLTLDTDSVDLGRIPQETLAEHVLTVTNRGDEVLVIRQIQTS